MEFPLDSFQTCLAFGPVGLYLLGVGVIHLRRRPTLVSGTRDLAALALALVGLIMVGPMELWFPESAALNFLGSLVWAPLVALYGLCVVMVLLAMRPRLVIYNLSTDELRGSLAEVVETLDPEARWAGDALSLPKLGVQLHLDAAGRLRTISLVATGPSQNYLGWQKLHRALAGPLSRLRVPRNPRGLLFLLTGLAVLALLADLVACDPQRAIEGMYAMFRV